MNRRVALLLLCALPFAAAPAAHAKVKVAATLPSLAALAKHVAGDLADVAALSSPQQDPHYVDARPSLIVTLSRADLLVVNGLQLERAWLQPILVQSRNPNIQLGSAGYLDASTVVTKLQVPQGQVDRAMGDLHPGGNPHFLFDARAAARITRAIGDRLAAVDATNAATYRKNADAYAKKLEAFAAEQAARFRALPDDKRRLVSYHRSLTYLYDWLGLTEVLTVEPKPGVPPDPAHVARVLKTMKAEHLRVIAQERFYPTNTSSTLAKLTAGQVVLLPGGADFDKGQSFDAHLAEVTEALYAALSR
jgi:zinc/manganese transport system substrate-binding protein